jgi:hypothetical protein
VFTFPHFRDVGHNGGVARDEEFSTNTDRLGFNC